MRRCVFALLGVVALGACGNDKVHLHPDGTIGPTLWKPKPGETKNWDIQVNAPFDFDTERAMMIVDLWASVPAAMTTPIDVPVGSQPQTIAMLHANQTVIICRVGLGGVKESDPDFDRFPTAAISSMTLEDDQTTHFLDFAQREDWEDIAFDRIDLAEQIGCDGIEPYLSDHGSIDLGFGLDSGLQTSWYSAVASAVHERELSVGMRNGISPPFIDAQQVQNYDWSLVERCAEPPSICDGVKPFLNARKAVFAIDYRTDFEGTPQDPQQLCDEQLMWNVQDGLVKDVALSSSFRLQCE